MCLMSKTMPLAELIVRRTYRERALERDEVALDTVDSIVRNCGLAVLKGRGNVDGLPFDRSLYPNQHESTLFCSMDDWRIEGHTFAAEKMSLMD